MKTITKLNVLIKMLEKIADDTNDITVKEELQASISFIHYEINNNL